MGIYIYNYIYIEIISYIYITIIYNSIYIYTVYISYHRNHRDVLKRQM